MIESGLTYVGVLLFTAAVVVQLDKRYPNISQYVPGIVVLYFLGMAFSSLGLWRQSTQIVTYQKHLMAALLPAMLFLMLLRCDLRKIFRLGPRMLLGFFSASITICLGFIVTYALLKSQLEPDTPKVFATLAGSWMGGTGNMAAIKEALGVANSRMAYPLMMDSVTYSVWVMVLLAFVPRAAAFNRWTKADTTLIDSIGAELAQAEEGQRTTIEFADLILLLGMAFLVAALSRYTATLLPSSAFLSTTTWTVLLATAAGIVGAVSPLGKVPGISALGNLLLYFIVALIASQAEFKEITNAGLYLFAGFLILGVHIVLLAIVAKLFKLDLFTCGVASLANIGGVASAPILAAAYSEVLVPTGVLMGMLGYVIGTVGGLALYRILAIM